MEGYELPSLASVPEESTLTRSVVQAEREWTKMSRQPFVSPGTRFVAQLSKATSPLSATTGMTLQQSAAWPAESTLARNVTCDHAGTLVVATAAAKAAHRASIFMFPLLEDLGAGTASARSLLQHAAAARQPECTSVRAR